MKTYHCPHCGSTMTESPKREGGYVKAPNTLPDCIGAEYQAGATVLSLLTKYNSNAARVREKLILLGVPMKKRGSQQGHKRARGNKVYSNERLTIGRMHSRGVPHPQIAKKFGISRERVRQIVMMLGLNARLPEIQARANVKASAKASESAERIEERKAKLAAADELYRKGAHWTVIADVMDWPATSAVYITNRILYYRKKKGLFAPRGMKVHLGNEGLLTPDKLSH